LKTGQTYTVEPEKNIPQDKYVGASSSINTSLSKSNTQTSFGIRSSSPNQDPDETYHKLVDYSKYLETIVK